MLLRLFCLSVSLSFSLCSFMSARLSFFPPLLLSYLSSFMSVCLSFLPPRSSRLLLASALSSSLFCLPVCLSPFPPRLSFGVSKKRYEQMKGCSPPAAAAAVRVFLSVVIIKRSLVDLNDSKAAQPIRTPSRNSLPRERRPPSYLSVSV